jgi:hypothetical protein
MTVWLGIRLLLSTQIKLPTLLADEPLYFRSTS